MRKYTFIYILAFTISIGATAQGIVINAGAINVNGSGVIVINNGGINNSGTFNSGTGTVVLSGTAASSSTSIGGSSTTTFYNLNINKSAGSAKLLNNLAISNNLILTTGNVDLNGYNIDLGLTGSLSGESATSSIIGTSGGTVNRIVNLNAPNAVNPGNIGIEITSTSNLGLTTIKRGQQQQINSSGFSINRYFDIIPTNNSGLNATVKMYYQDAELAGINESELKIWSKSIAANTIWQLLGSTAQDVNANWVSKTGVDSLNRLTLASNTTNPLPVHLTSFSAQLISNAVQLNWSTASEINSQSFDIERAYDGRNFVKISTTVAAGNSSTVRNYSAIDATDFNASAFYRLKQINKDGSFTYSQIVVVNKGNISNNFISVFPNPTHGKVQLRFVSNSNNPAQLQVNDLNGKIIVNQFVAVAKGINNVEYDISKLAKGVYYFRLNGIDSKTIQVIKY